MIISIIAAIGENRELGKDNKLLWNIREDLKHFQKITKNHVVIMGRKTYESIGKPLPNRFNIIITRDENYRPFIDSNQQIICPSLEKAFDLLRNPQFAINQSINLNEVFIIGGGQIYSQGIKFANKLYLTIVEGGYEADTFFPDYSDFKKVISQEEKQEGKYKFKFVELEK